MGKARIARYDLSMNQSPDMQTKPDNMIIIAHARSRVEAHLAALLPVSATTPKKLQDCLRHTLLAPGKRFRPMLTLLISQSLLKSAVNEGVMDAACAGEMVHTASLILDDLPCMDDAPLRRNRDSAHVAFGESTAILTAVALLNRAFGIIARAQSLPADTRNDLSSRLSKAVGANGLIAGQIADLANDNSEVSLETVEHVNRLKTGALFDYAILAAGKLAGADAPVLTALEDFSEQLGLAFQLLDDVKDVMMADSEAEKTTGRDVGKATIVALTGNAASLARLRDYLTNAQNALARAGLSDSVVSDVITTQFAFAYEQ